MSSTPLYHPDDDGTNPHPEDQGISYQGGPEDPADAGASRSSQDADSADTDLDELNDEGVGGTVGSKDTFEPEESDASRHAGRGDSPKA
ncbi:hypothetical protein [Brachybacterium paraconglomeratum]|uniref:hypothetical protein n=1 Tax=Brachybacterium paraconglomeratum TaxID=173362 RepID=UPI00223AC6F4|nr:hypothetical protein [Brachybacterium paraconglomeratum]MCT1435930.1 hypothetical protein [Brachybacterium paraconglomeratum]